MYMSIDHVCDQCLWKSEEGVEITGTVLIDGCEPLCVCWASESTCGCSNSNLGPCEEQPALFFFLTEQALIKIYFE